jgi:hypothetical protein
MSVKAYRQWRVHDDGTLLSLFHGTEWPVVFRAPRAPQELVEYVVKRLESTQRWENVHSMWWAPANDYPTLAVTQESPRDTMCCCEKCQRTIVQEGLHWKQPLAVGDTIHYFDKVGIYAVRSPKDYYSQFQFLMPALLASGQVELFGHIVEHERGYRAEAALVCGPLELSHGASPELAKKVSDKYECEVTILQAVTNADVAKYYALATIDWIAKPA